MAVNVARIYEQTIRPGRSYCRVCLRSAEETILVSPNNILQFTEALKLNIFEGKRVRSVCYICEAYAGTALRIYQACVNAVSVKNVCQPLKDMKPDDPVPEWLRKAILGCNANIKEYRKKSLLQQTEVLVVDSSGIEWQPEEGTTVNEPTRIVAPPVPRQLPHQQQPVETVVLDDDDDVAPAKNQIIVPKPKVTIPKLVPIATLLDPNTKNTQHLATLLPDRMQIICRHDKEENNFVLHPLIIGENGNFIAPSLGVQVMNGQLIHDAKVYKPLPLVDCTQMSYVVHGTELKEVQKIPNTTNTQSNEPEEILPDKKSSAPTKAERIYGTNNFKTHKRISSGADSANKKNKTENSQFVVDLDIINNLLEKNRETNSRITNNDEPPIAVISNVTSNAEDLIAVISNVTSDAEDPLAIISNVVSTSDNLISEKGAVKDVTARTPRLIERNDKIDWEDKIPMDVISFVDSADPLDRDLIVPDRLPSKHRQATTQTAAGQTTPRNDGVKMRISYSDSHAKKNTIRDVCKKV